MSRLATSRLLLGMLSVLFASAWAAAQQEPAQKDAPTTVSAAALILGAKMEESASPEFLKWARSYAKKELLGRTVPSEDAIGKLFAERFAKATPQARAAGAFLLWYEAYQQGTDSQELGRRRLEEIERDIQYLEDDLRQVENTPVPLAAANSRIEAESRVRARLESAEQQRKLHERAQDQIGERVDVCLQRLAAAYEPVKDSDPAVIRGLK